MDSKKKTILGYVLSFGVLLLGSLLLAVACTPSHHNYIKKMELYTSDKKVYYYNPTSEPNFPSPPGALWWAYFGEQDGVYRVSTVKNHYTLVVTCRSPCDEGESMALTSSGEIVANSHVNIKGTIFEPVLEDAMGGELATYRP